MLHEAILALGGYPAVLFTKEGNKCDFVQHLHPCERVLLDRITLVAADYEELKIFIDGNINNTALVDTAISEKNTENCEELQGGYLKAFSRAVYDILDPYRKDISSLEKEILNDPYLPLSYVAYRAEKYAIFLNILNKMIKQMKREKIHGCQILGFLRRQCASGVDEIKDALEHILFSCHMYFYKQLTNWLLYGHLMDDYKEFFIKKLDQPCKISFSRIRSDESVFSGDIPVDQRGLYPAFCDYGIDFEMLPIYIPAPVAYKILFTGQTILMFGNDPDEKTELTDEQKGSLCIWGGKEGEFLCKLKHLQQLRVFDLNKFEMTINEIRTYVIEHLWHLALEKAELFQQLKLIKDFFLLGRGELFLEFIRQVSPILARSSPAACTRDVNQAFQIAARKVLLTDEAALDKFSFELHRKENEIESKEPFTWKHLNLCYKVSWPLHLLFTSDTLDFYNRLFKFLLRVKKVQADLHETWINQIMFYKSKPGSSLHPSLWKFRTELTFLVDNLQYYLQANVLESQYAQMLSVIQNTRDFEKVQHAHAIFQSNILSQTFLLIGGLHVDDQWSGNSLPGLSYTVKTELFEENPVHRSLVHILSLCESFCEQIKQWHSPLEEHELSNLIKMNEEFNSHLQFLMLLLSNLRSQPCGTYLSQLLLRLDFNRWFSRSIVTKPLPNLQQNSTSTSIE